MKTRLLTVWTIALLCAAAPAWADYFQNVQKGETHVQDQASGQMLKATQTASEDAGGLPIVDTGNGLQGIYWSAYTMTAHDKGSRMSADLGIFRPKDIPTGWYMVGDAVAGYGYSDGYAPPSYPVLLVRDMSKEQDLLKPPIRYERLYVIWGGNQMNRQIVISKPIPPEGYTSLGLVANEAPINSNQIVPPDNYRCIKTTLLKKTDGRRAKTDVIWSKGEADRKVMGSTPQDFSMHMLTPNPGFKQYAGALDHPTDLDLGSDHNKGCRMNAGDYLHQGDFLVSPNGNFFLLLQSDGNLVEYTHYQGNADSIVWLSGTAGKATQCFAAMQGDGNFVLYKGTPDRNEGPLWSAATNSGTNFLQLQDDGNLVVYKKGGGAVWSSANTVFDLLYSNVLKNPDCLDLEILTDRPEVAARKVRGDASLAAIQKYQVTYGQAVQNLRKNDKAPDDPTRTTDKDYTRNAYGATHENLDSSQVDTQESGADQKTLPANVKSLLAVFGLDQATFSDASFDSGTIKDDRTGYNEDFAIGKVKVSDLQFPSALKEDRSLQMALVIDPSRKYSGDFVLMARNYHGKGTAYAAVLIVDISQIAATSKLYQKCNEWIPQEARLKSQRVGITLGMIGWADKVAAKKIPGLKASFKWKLKDMPEIYAQLFAELMGETSSKAGSVTVRSDNTQLVFQKGFGYLAGLDIRKIDAVAGIDGLLKDITQKLPELLFSVLPMNMDDIAVGEIGQVAAIAGVDYPIDTVSLFKGISIPQDNFLFSDETIEVIYRKPEKGKIPEVVGRISSWMDLKLSDKAKVRAFTRLSMPIAGTDAALKSVELAGTIDGTVHHPFGLIDKDHFPDVSLVNPEIGARLGFTGWSLWVGGKPELGKDPHLLIEYLRVGVMPNPPFISFVEADLDKVGLTTAIGPIAGGSIKGLGTDFHVGSLPIDKFTLGGFQWGLFETKGPRIIYSTMDIDLLEIHKGVVAMGSLNLEDAGKHVELGQFEFMQLASGVVAGRGDVSAFEVGPLSFTGVDNKDHPQLDVYLTNGPSTEDHIFFSGALKIGDDKLNSLIRLNTTKDDGVEITSYGKLFDVGTVELQGKGSLLSLLDKSTGDNLVFEGGIRDADVLTRIEDRVCDKAKGISVVKEAVSLVGGTVFTLESVTIESSVALLHEKKISEATLTGSSFGQRFSVQVTDPFPSAQMPDKLASAAADKIALIAQRLVPDPFKFLQGLKDEAAKLSGPLKDEFKNLAGKDPTGVLDGMSSSIDTHAKEAAKAAEDAQKTAQETAQKAAETARKVADAILDAAEKMWHSIKFW